MNTITNKRETDFSKITKIDDLILYLNDSTKRLKNRNYLYHYTKLDRVVDIFEGRKWHLGSAACMNDRLEYKNGEPSFWKNIFFACFMTEVKENIGMWSMYAQPWEDGVLITIPKKIVIDWIKNIDKIYEISCYDFKPTGKIININSDNKVFLSSVAYSNCDNPDGKEKLTWSNVTNTNIQNATHIAELTGYVKDSAWDYEREIRIKAVLQNGHNCSRVAIEIPDEVLDSITIVAGPLFRGTLEARLNDEIKRRKIELNQSLFFEKLNIDSGCSVCQYRNNGGQYGNKN